MTQNTISRTKKKNRRTIIHLPKRVILKSKWRIPRRKVSRNTMVENSQPSRSLDCRLIPLLWIALEQHPVKQDTKREFTNKYTMLMAICIEKTLILLTRAIYKSHQLLANLMNTNRNRMMRRVVPEIHCQVLNLTRTKGFITMNT